MFSRADKVKYEAIYIDTGFLSPAIHSPDGVRRARKSVRWTDFTDERAGRPWRGGTPSRQFVSHRLRRWGEEGPENGPVGEARPENDPVDHFQCRTGRQALASSPRPIAHAFMRQHSFKKRIDVFLRL